MTRREWTSPDGRIRLINADCLEVLPELAPGSVDAVVTDPPWNCGYFGASDDVPWREYRGLLTQWVCSFERLCDGQVWFLSTKSLPHVADLFDGYKPFASVKNFSQMTRTSLPNCWDVAFIRDTSGQYLGNGRNWFLADTAGMLRERTCHPTPRTVDVMEYVLSMYSWGCICDPFSGSFTTAIACMRLGRRFIGIEREPSYFEAGLERVKAELNRAPLFEPAPAVQRSLITEAVA